MNQNVKELFDGFMSTFIRPKDVVFSGKVTILKPNRYFKILQDVNQDEPDYTSFEIGKRMGELLNAHELLAKTSKIYIALLGDAGTEQTSKHITNAGGEFLRYKLNIALEP